ncbi:DUF2141 domain-containing protein [Pontixanthobacter gangjinensis]|uniref:DUF2141 domain-containing protein n=1 Tax=Pontixanthobacter gangjinensis TaxID=1028742 RepID=A0A6I4SJ72_9SPHN|nr:DUF2141 domain-containing protein [Pontixanthobacter gangjinensis]MXO55779.1 DUF2141 domain-containing protein [Pontixanthobacter gangjinensis]
MRDRQGHLGRICAIGLLGSATLLLAGNTPRDTGSVKVTVNDLRNSNGVVRACMTTNPKQFPKCRGDVNAYSVVVSAQSSVTLTFKGVKPGRYAIALLHDENNNGKADRALMMMPTEGYGFSRDAKVSMGPPKFSAAAFDVTATDQTQTIRMRYML